MHVLAIVIGGDVEQQLERADKTADRFAKHDFGIPGTVTSREQLPAHACRMAAHNAPAAVVIGGEWFGPGWDAGELTEGAVEEWDLWFTAFQAALSDDAVLTVVDCHM